jgi:hypothetical protein
MSDAYLKAVRATKGLTTDEQKKLREYLTGLISSGGSSSADRAVASLDRDWVLQGIADYCRDAGMPPVKMETMLTSNGYAAYKVKADDVKVYLAKVGNKNEQRALLRIGLAMLHKTMSYKRMTISYLTFMQHIHRMPGAINREFPGYMEAGIIHMIIRGENSVRKKSSERVVQRKRIPPADQ